MPRSRVFTRSKPSYPSSSCNQNNSNYDPNGQQLSRNSFSRNYSNGSVRKQNTPRRWYHISPNDKYKKSVEVQSSSTQTEDDIDAGYISSFTFASNSPMSSCYNEDKLPTVDAHRPVDLQITNDVSSGELYIEERLYQAPVDKSNESFGLSNPDNPKAELQPAPLLLYVDSFDVCSPDWEDTSIQSSDTEVNDSLMNRTKVHRVPVLSEYCTGKSGDEDRHEVSIPDADETHTKRKRKHRRRSKRKPASEDPNIVAIPNLSNHWDVDSGVEVCSQSSALSSSNQTSHSPSDECMTSCSGLIDPSPEMPYYFKEPDLDLEFASSNEIPLPWNLDELEADDDDSVFSWSEFDISQNDICDNCHTHGATNVLLETQSEEPFLSFDGLTIEDKDCSSSKTEDVDGYAIPEYEDASDSVTDDLNVSSDDCTTETALFPLLKPSCGTIM